MWLSHGWLMHLFNWIIFWTKWRDSSEHFGPAYWWVWALWSCGTLGPCWSFPGVSSVAIIAPSSLDTAVDALPFNNSFWFILSGHHMRQSSCGGCTGCPAQTKGLAERGLVVSHRIWYQLLAGGICPLRLEKVAAWAVVINWGALGSSLAFREAQAGSPWLLCIWVSLCIDLLIGKPLSMLWYIPLVS